MTLRAKELNQLVGMMATLSEYIRTLKNQKTLILRGNTYFSNRCARMPGGQFAFMKFEIAFVA